MITAVGVVVVEKRRFLMGNVQVRRVSCFWLTGMWRGIDEGIFPVVSVPV